MREVTRGGTGGQDCPGLCDVMRGLWQCWNFVTYKMKRPGLLHCRCTRGCLRSKTRYKYSSWRKGPVDRNRPSRRLSGKISSCSRVDRVCCWGVSLKGWLCLSMNSFRRFCLCFNYPSCRPIPPMAPMTSHWIHSYRGPCLLRVK